MKVEPKYDAAKKKYASTIDVLAKPSETEKAIFTLENQYDGYFILEATNAVEIEKYGLSIEGSKLTIGKMPANETSIKVSLKLTVLGLNGSTKSTTQIVTLSQGVEATGELADKTVTLAADSKDAQLRWKIADLGFTAVQLDNFLKGTVKMTATREVAEEEDGVVELNKYVAYNSTVTFYDAKGDKITNAYGGDPTNYVSFGFDVAATDQAADLAIGGEVYTGEKFTAANYVLALTSTSSNTVIYAANATLTVSNPTAVAIKLNPAYVENGVLQVTGGKKILTSGGFVDYDITEGIIIDTKYITGGVVGITFVDQDKAEFDENGGDPTSKDFANWNWINSNALKVNKWIDGKNVDANKQHMYKERNIRATYVLFGNDKNEVTFDFKVYVKSEVYSADPTKAIVMNSMSAVYGGADKTNQIDIVKAVKSSVFIAGSDKGKAYDLFAVRGGDVKVTGYQYGTIPSVTSKDGKLKFAVDSKDMMIEIAVADMKAFGFKSDAIVKAQQGDAKYYVLAENTLDSTADNDYVGVKTLADIWSDATVGAKYYNNSASTGYYVRNTNAKGEVSKIEDADKAINTLFSTYASKVAFGAKKDIVVGRADSKTANAKITGVYLKVVDPAYAKALIKNVEAFDGTKDLNTFVADSANDAVRIIEAVDQLSEGVVDSAPVEMQLIVKDAWNKTMIVPFTITLKTK